MSNKEQTDPGAPILPSIISVLRFSVSKKVGDFETLAIHLESSGESSELARYNMEWLLAQAMAVQLQSDRPERSHVPR